MIYRMFARLCSLALLVTFLCGSLMAQDPDPMNGQSLFIEKCASCHNNDMVSDMTGPALQGAKDRWKKFPGQLNEWIRNSQALVSAGQPRAVSLFNQWDKSVMTANPDLTDAMIDDILLYIEMKAANEGPFAKKEADGPAVATADGGSEGSTAILWLLALVLGIAVVLLARNINALNRLAEKQAGDHVSPEKTIRDIILSPAIIKMLVFLLILVGGYTTVNNAIGLGRQQNYAPEQPIKFSHELHAGKNGINCQYCHDGARRSKHSVIPATNTCMNCHKAVKKGPEHGTAEILKIYASSGFNPRQGAYFDKSITAEDRLAIYEEWLLKDMMKKEHEANPTVTERTVKKQLEAAKGFIAKPIEWVRVHNLPDHVYFNHSQHVTVGKVKCQTCHGAVEEMPVLKQHSTLSMGWCINCHRQTEVQFKDGMNASKTGPYDGDDNKANSYYTDYQYYERYHQEVSDGKRKGVTVEEIGGLECQKCHY
ncbi:MAG: c-type cytochrome [Aureispira sp.]|nr:c-type cytochrome [Aureispira sp.]